MVLATTLVLMASAAQARTITASNGGEFTAPPIDKFYINSTTLRLCQLSDLKADACAGFLSSGETLSEVKKLAQSRPGWAADPFRVDTTDALNANDRSKFLNFDSSKISSANAFDGNFIFALSGLWGDPAQGARSTWSAYYLFEGVSFNGRDSTGSDPRGEFLSYSLDDRKAISMDAVEITSVIGLTVEQVSLYRFNTVTPGDNAVPEPDTLTLTLLSLAGLGWLGWRARRAKTQPRR